VPVTAKLSSKFYERFGDDIAGELVDWFNAVDHTYQTQLKETNELNWERFKATLQAETGAIRGEMATMDAGLRGEMATMDAGLRGEMATMDAGLRGEMAKMDAGLRAEMAKMDAGLRAEIVKSHEGFLRAMEATRADLHKWMFVYWSGSMVGVGGLIVGMQLFSPR
jgi:hypothetical protein